MNPQYLDLSRSQLAVSWKRSRFNHYSDRRKQQFHDNLGQLYEILMAKDFCDPSLTKDDLHFYRNVLEFFKDSLALLSNNTISSVPHEFIECLNIAARQWLTDFDDYIIVMIDGQYAISPQVEDFRMFYTLIKTRLGVEFNSILLKVCMPRQLSRDYLTNVCLFHELGHFIDEKLKISEGAYNDQLLKKWSKGKKGEIDKWFFNGNEAYHIVATPIGPQIKGELQSLFYLKEYFADLFGSQYVGENVLNYLDYISDDPSIDGLRHPSDDKRRQMYSDFTKSPSANPVLESLFESTLAQAKHGLMKKYVDVDQTDMHSFVPSELLDEQQLLSLFKMGWDVYKSGSEPFEKQNNLSSPLPSDKIYECVNNLIEKSINNYLMIRDWNNAKKNL